MNSHCPFVLKHSHCVLSMFGHDVGHLEQNWLYLCANLVHCIFDLDYNLCRLVDLDHDFFDLDYKLCCLVDLDHGFFDLDYCDLDHDGRDLDYGFFDAVRCNLDYYFVDVEHVRCDLDHGGSVVANARCIVSSNCCCDLDQL